MLGDARSRIYAFPFSARLFDVVANRRCVWWSIRVTLRCWRRIDDSRRDIINWLKQLLEFVVLFCICIGCVDWFKFVTRLITYRLANNTAIKQLNLLFLSMHILGKITRHYSRYFTVEFCYVHKSELSYMCSGHDIKLHPHRVKLYWIECVEPGLVLAKALT